MSNENLAVRALKDPSLLFKVPDTSMTDEPQTYTTDDQSACKKSPPMYQNYSEVADWLEKSLSKEYLPYREDGNRASIERFIGCLDDLMSKVSKALRGDRTGAIPTPDCRRITLMQHQMEASKKDCEKELSWLRQNHAQEENTDMNKVGELQDKVDDVGKYYIKSLEDRKKLDRTDLYYPTKEQLEEQKMAPQSQNDALGYCKAHNSPLYDNECLLCVGESKEEYTVDAFLVALDQALNMATKRSNEYHDGLHKEAATPQVTFTVDAFTHAICTIMMESKAQAGHNIEEVYETLNKEYKFDKRDKLSILHTLRNMGYIYFKDRSGTEFMKNYFASLNNYMVDKKGN